MRKQYPKILIVSRGVWEDSGTSSTLTNIFANYPSEQLSQIYIETKMPNTNHCSSFFQISEFSLLKKTYKWKIQTGHKVDSVYVQDEEVAQKEAEMMQYVRGHRSFFYTILREFLWHLNGWKSRELKSFINEENPDVIWLTGSPLILMNRLSQYVVKEAKKPYCIYEMDDVYSYNNCGKNPLKYLYRFFLRKNVKKLISGASQLFVISPKMKREYDSIFGTDSIFLTKSIDFSSVTFHPYQIHQPVRMVYMGQIIYDRLSSLELVGKALDEFNKEKQHIVLDIYTNNFIDELRKSQIIKGNSVFFHAPVPYSEVKNVIDQYDIVVFVESLDKKFKNIARLSFSTKITDYLSSGKCVLAVGPSDIAPIEYLKENDAALVANNYDEIKERLQDILLPETIESYSYKAYSCGKANHNKTNMDTSVFGKLIEIANNKE